MVCLQFALVRMMKITKEEQQQKAGQKKNFSLYIDVRPKKGDYLLFVDSPSRWGRV